MPPQESLIIIKLVVFNLTASKIKLLITASTMVEDNNGTKKKKR